MAKKKKRDIRKKSAKKSLRVPAWKELVAIMKAGSYYTKVYIIMQLKALGYDVGESNVSYVMTSVRKHGHLCVYSRENGYTATPTGLETLADIRKRRRISDAWLRNIKALVSYVKSNWASLTKLMDPKDSAQLRCEIAYHAAAIASNDSLRNKHGVN